MTQQVAQPFHAQQHLVPLEEGQYLPVQWRLVWFHQATGPRAGYVTQEQHQVIPREFLSTPPPKLPASDPR